MDFKMYSGNSKSLIITVYDKPNGSVVNISTATAVKWQLFHAAPASTDPIVSKSLTSGVTLTAPTSGQFTVSLSATDTAGLSGKFYYEAEVTDATSNKETVVTGYIDITLKRIA